MGMNEDKRNEDAKRKEVDATIHRWVAGLAAAVKHGIVELKIPPNKSTGLIVSATLIRIACKIVKDNEVDMPKFMGAVESIFQAEFAPKDAAPGEVPTVVPSGTADGKPLIVLG